jgi:hypothetical protein
LSIGVESLEDLIVDIQQALEISQKPEWWTFVIYFM